VLRPAVDGPNDLAERLAQMPQVCVTRTGYPQKRSRSTVTLSGLPSRGAIFTHQNDVGNVVQSIHERVLGSIVSGTWTPTLLPERGAFRGPLEVFRRRVGSQVGSHSLPFTTEHSWASMGVRKGDATRQRQLVWH
jgi:hypothetical protein